VSDLGQAWVDATKGERISSAIETLKVYQRELLAVMDNEGLVFSGPIAINAVTKALGLVKGV